MSVDIPAVNNHPSRKTGVRRMPDEAYDKIIKFGDVVKADVSLPPLFDVNNAASIKSQLQMLGNDQYGDCEAVRAANHVFLNTSLLTDSPYYPTLDEVIALYKTQNPDFPNQDDGMDTGVLLKYLNKTGWKLGDGTTHKVAFYASVDATNIEQVQHAIDIAGAVWVDIIVMSGNQTEFDDNKPWTDDDSDIEGGHAVLGPGTVLTPVSSTSEYIDILTWAAETSLSESFWNGETQGQALVMGVYLVLWDENLTTRQFHEGFDLQTLSDLYQSLTGRPLPIPQPTPTPQPPSPTPTPQPPAPTPDPGGASFPGALVAVDQHIHSAAARRHMNVTDWLNRHFVFYFDLDAEGPVPTQVVAGSPTEIEVDVELD